MVEVFEDITTYLDGKSITLLAPEGVETAELIYMRDRYVAFTNQGIYEIKDGALVQLILEAEIGAGDVFASWSLDISFQGSKGANTEWKSYDTFASHEEPEALLPMSFYKALTDLEQAYPNQKATVLDVLIAIYGARNFYADWNAEACWKRALTFYTLDQLEMAV